MLVGHAGHEEVKGTLGVAPGKVVLVGTVEEAEALEIPDPDHVAAVTQTTLSVDDTRDIMETLKRRFPAMATPKTDDICYATQNRQNAVKELVEVSDAMLVVGSKQSSNANRMVEVARMRGGRAFLVDSLADVEPEMLEGVKSLGLTASASSPEWLVEEIIGAFSRTRRGGRVVENQGGADSFPATQAGRRMISGQPRLSRSPRAGRPRLACGRKQPGPRRGRTRSKTARCSGGEAILRSKAPSEWARPALRARCAKELNARLVLEGVEDNPFLERFYEDPDKYALPVQLYFLLTRYNQQRELAQQDLFAQATVADYLFSKDRIFAALNLAPDEIDAVRERLSAARRADAEAGSGGLYSCKRRCAERRGYANAIATSSGTSVCEYLERVSSAFRDFFFYYDETPLLVVDTSEMDFVEDSEDLKDLIREIDERRNGIQHFVPRKR